MKDKFNSLMKMTNSQSYKKSPLHRGPLNFDKFASEGNQFVNDVAHGLGMPRATAARIIRAVLHAIRDRMPPDDAIQFAQGLPMALKAVFIDQYNLSDTPVIIRREEDFINFVRSKDAYLAGIDFPDDQSVKNAIHYVFNVLYGYMDHGQLNQVRHVVGHEIVDLIDGYYGKGRM
jgi:uncharacterized protein (DUF2267 family)